MTRVRQRGDDNAFYPFKNAIFLRFSLGRIVKYLKLTKPICQQNLPVIIKSLT